MDLEELRAFLAIADTGSFLAASTELGVSRGMLRRRVDALEARIGTPLVERSSKGVVITDAGALLAKQGRRLVQSSSALLTAVREVAREPAGELRVNLPIGLPPHMLGPVFALLRATIPKVVLHTHFTHDPIGGLLDDVDVVVHFGDESPGSGWISHELLRLPVRLLAHVGYLRRHGTPRHVDELAGHMLSSWQGPGLDATKWPLLDGTTIDVSPMIVSNDAHMLRQAMIAGLGIGLLPDADIIEPNAAPGSLVVVLEGVVGRELTLRLAFPAVLTGSPKIARIIEAAQQLVAKL